MSQAFFPSSSDDYSQSSAPSLRTKDEILEDAQEIIYDCLFTSVQTEEPEATLELFQSIFLSCSGSFCDAYFLAIQELAFSNQEQIYHNTLKRSCYILLNNWESRRKHLAIVQLVQDLRNYVPKKLVMPPWKLRLRQWLSHFLESSDYADLRLMSERFIAAPPKSPSPPAAKPWTDRYAYYFLVPQYENSDNPPEQRETARHISDQIRYRFKLDLAMYVAHSQASYPSSHNAKLHSDLHRRVKPKSPSSNHVNPTGLGDETLRLIKLIVKRNGYFSYRNIANIFQDQTAGLDYFSYKRSLVQYLIFSMEKQPFVKKFQAVMTAKLDTVYPQHDDTIVSKSLCQRTCNQVVRFLTTENGQGPSELFTALLTQGGTLTLVVTLLKLVLLSPTVRNYLDLRIAYLVQYYNQYPPEECRWFSYFLDVFSVTFAIHAEGVQYTLVDTEEETPTATTTAPKPPVSPSQTLKAANFAKPSGQPQPSPASLAYSSPKHSHSSPVPEVPPKAPPETPYEAQTIEEITLIGDLPNAEVPNHAWNNLDRYRIFAQSTHPTAIPDEDSEGDTELETEFNPRHQPDLDTEAVTEFVAKINPNPSFQP